MSNEYHIPVLQTEAIDELITDRRGVYVDATVGGGGHAEKILERIYPLGTLIGIDVDSDALTAAGKRLHRFQSHLILVHDNMMNIETIVRGHSISHLRGVLLDLGVSSFQLDEPSKGFSYRGNELLDMRMDRRQALTARTIINSYSERELADLFWRFGEEKNSRRIARRIVHDRQNRSIDTTQHLAAIVEETARGQFLTKTLARVFQALRIAVNNELEALRRTLDESLKVLEPGGRIVVISYHSLEDRIVKEFFQRHSSSRMPSGSKLVPDTRVRKNMRILSRKPIIATEEERRVNPRSRSAKMRVAEKI